MQRDVLLGPRTTLGLGGAARFFLPVTDDVSLRWGLDWAEAQALPVAVLGGGSNLVVADAGFPGLVLSMEQRGTTAVSEGEYVTLSVAAGEDWDAFVHDSVARGYAGVECLAGIPGCVGATPIQNVGAYGQDVSETIVGVRAFDRKSKTFVKLSNADCQFSYRHSYFKDCPDRYVVVSVDFRLRCGGVPSVRYAELVRHIESEHLEVTLINVRDTVVRLRRRKSMVLDPQDPNSRSAGSFFTNPIVSEAQGQRLMRLCEEEGVVTVASDVPHWPVTVDGQPHVKFAAAWLIERAGFSKGYRYAGVGISQKHALALVNYEHGTTTELLALAHEIQTVVEQRFGIRLIREPRYWGPSGS